MKSSSFGHYQCDFGDVHISSGIVRRAVFPEIESAENVDFASRKWENDVTLEFEEGKAVINLSIAVAMDVPIYREAVNLQSGVRRAVESLTGLEVSKVNVQVERVFEKQPKPAKNIAEKGRST